MMRLAQTELEVATTMNAFDTDPWLLTVANGTLDLRAGMLRPHRRDDFITKVSPIADDPGARCPIWDAFLQRVLAGDEEMIQFLQRAAGYSLTGLTTERLLFILCGPGRNGKTTFLEVLLAILGDYAVRTPTQTLLVKRDGSIPNDIAALRGRRLVTASEGDEGGRLAEGTLKELTGGDTIAARFMRAEWFTFRPVCKLWFATNHTPIIRGTDHGIWDRIRLIPFPVRIPEAEQDTEFGAKLLTEASGILAWAVRGCLAWQRKGLGHPEPVRQATAGYRAEMDVLGHFLADCCIVNEGALVSAEALFAAYTRWAATSGEPRLTKTMLGRQLKERGFTSGRRGTPQVRTWFGIGLRSELPGRGGGHLAVA
jgi:putative DNA primase/helicase